MIESLGLGLGVRVRFKAPRKGNKVKKKNIFMDLVKYLAVSMILFLGIWGIFLNRKNIIIILQGAGGLAARL